MINFDKYQNECMDVLVHSLAIVDGKPTRCSNSICYKCDFRTSSDSCSNCAKKWLTSTYEEPSPKLTKREKEFLECFLNTSRRTISRDVTSGLLGFGYNGNWCDRLKEDTFQFIKKGECWTFEDLLKLEVEE